jgi:hypothetical protein
VIALVFLEEFSLCLHRASQRHPKKEGKTAELARRIAHLIDWTDGLSQASDAHEAELMASAADLAEVDIDEYNHVNGDTSIVETRMNEDGVAVTTC